MNRERFSVGAQKLKDMGRKLIPLAAFSGAFFTTYGFVNALEPGDHPMNINIPPAQVWQADYSYLGLDPTEECTPPLLSAASSEKPEGVNLQNVSIISYAAPEDQGESIIHEGDEFGMNNAITSFTSTDNIPLYLELRFPESHINVLYTKTPAQKLTGTWEISDGLATFVGTIDYTSGAFQGLNVIAEADEFGVYPVRVRAADHDSNGDGQVNSADAEIVDEYNLVVGSEFDVETAITTDQSNYRIGDEITVTYFMTNTGDQSAPMNALATIPENMRVINFIVPRGELSRLPNERCNFAYFEPRLESGDVISFEIRGVLTATGKTVSAIRFVVPNYFFEDTNSENNGAQAEITTTLFSYFLSSIYSQD